MNASGKSLALVAAITLASSPGMPAPAQAIPALAEVLWVGTAEKDCADFLRRLRAHLPRLDAMGVKYRPLDIPQ